MPPTNGIHLWTRRAVASPWPTQLCGPIGDWPGGRTVGLANGCSVGGDCDNGDSGGTRRRTLSWKGDRRWTVGGGQYRQRKVRRWSALPPSSGRPWRWLDRRRRMPRVSVASSQVRRPHRSDGSRSAGDLRQDPRVGGRGEGRHGHSAASARSCHGARWNAVCFVAPLAFDPRITVRVPSSTDSDQLLTLDLGNDR